MWVGKERVEPMLLQDGARFKFMYGSVPGVDVKVAVSSNSISSS